MTTWRYTSAAYQAGLMAAKTKKRWLGPHTVRESLRLRELLTCLRGKQSLRMWLITTRNNRLRSSESYRLGWEQGWR